MASSTVDILTPRRSDRKPGYNTLPVGAGQKLLVGTMATLVAGFLKSSIAADAGQGVFVVVGEGANNTGGADGAISCDVEFRSDYLFKINGTAPTTADIGTVVYALDNQTVTRTASTNTRVGEISYLNDPELGEAAVYVMVEGGAR